MNLNYMYVIDYIFKHRKGYIANLEELIGIDTLNDLEENGFIEVDEGLWKITFIGEEEYYRIFPNIDNRKWYIKYPRKIVSQFLQTFI